MKNTISLFLLVGVICSCMNRNTAPSQSGSTELQEPPQKDAVVQTADFDSLVTMFPEWTEDSINKGVFESRIKQFPYNRTIPKRMTDTYFPLNEEERSVDNRYNYSAGYRIDTGAFHILFVKKELEGNNIEDDGGYPYCCYEVMTFSSKGRFLDKMEVARYGDFWSGTLCGTRQPLRLHVEKTVKTDFDGEFTPFPIYIDEIVVRLATNGKILADTLRSYISYAKREEDADGMSVHQWNRNDEEPAQQTCRIQEQSK